MTTSAPARASGRPSVPARRPEHRDPGAGGSWFVSIALVLVVAASSLLARPMFTTADWTADAIVMAAAVIGAAALARTFTGGVLWPALAAVAAFVVVLSLRLQPDSVAGFFAVWGEEAVGLAEQLGSDAPPFRETHEAVTALVAVVGVVSIVCDLFVFGLRGRVSAVLPVLVFPVLPVAMGVPDVDLWPALWLAGAFALFLFAAGWWHQRIADDRLADAGYLVDDRGFSGWFGAAATAAAGLVLAMVASFAAPAPQGVSWLMPNPGASLSTSRANPILDLGDDLRRGEPVPVLQYASSITQGQLPYLSLVSLTQLDGGREWAPGEFVADASTDGGAQLPDPAGLAADAPTVAFGANVILDAGVSAYLPHPGQALRVQDLTTSYGFASATGDLRQVEGEPLAQHYEYAGVVVTAGAAQIAAAELRVPAGLEALTAVPEGASTDAIRAALDGIVDASLPVYAQAQQVQAYLVSDAFTYSETAPVNAGYDGTNLDVTAQFLEARSGYCVHFSSAMAVMARLLGIPARIQVGFTPGTPVSINEQGQVIYQVTSNDLHAWAELWIDGLGWVPFETTPSSGLGNLVAPSENVDDTAPEQPVQTTQAPENTADAGDAQTPTPEPSDEPQPTPSDDATATADAGFAWPAWTGPALLALAGLAALAVLAAMPGVARVVRRRRRRAIVAAGGRDGAEASDGAPGASAGAPGAPGAGAEPAALAWRELLDEALDHRAGVPRSADIRRQERRLAEIASPPAAPTGDGEPSAPPASSAPSADEVAAALERLRVAAERAAFDRPEAEPPAVDWADVALVERGIRAGATRGGRLRAIATPASLPLLRILARRARTALRTLRGARRRGAGREPAVTTGRIARPGFGRGDRDDEA